MTSSNKKQRVFVTTGVTAPLKDGHTREVTLVAVLTTEDKTLYPRTEKTECIRLKSGTRKVFSVITDTLRVTETILSFGLAVTSPKDVKGDFEALLAYEKALADPKVLQKPKKPTPVVTPENGVAIAVGKAKKEGSSLLYSQTYSTNFFTKSMINSMLEVKLKQIMEVPDNFIDISKVPQSKTKATPAHSKDGVQSKESSRVVVHA